MRVYVAHPFPLMSPATSNASAPSAGPSTGHVPIAPHLYLTAFLDEKTEHELALVLCLEAHRRLR